MNNISITKVFYSPVWLFYLIIVSCGTSKGLQRQFHSDIFTVADTKEKIKMLEKYDTIQVKYARLLKTRPEMITNTRLYCFIEKWMNVPYKWGGMDERGIDCSAFLQRLLSEVYTITIPRTSVQQFFTNRIEPFASVKYLSEGDIVFFRTLNNTFVSHVGLYLHNGIFINCSSSKGVSLGNLDDPYWRTRYVAAGRVKAPR